jgi:hypothetical protein
LVARTGQWDNTLKNKNPASGHRARLGYRVGADNAKRRRDQHERQAYSAAHRLARVEQGRNSRPARIDQ